MLFHWRPKNAFPTIVRVDRRGRKPCYREFSNEYWDNWASIFSLRIASSTLQTTSVRLMGLNGFESVVWLIAFVTGVTMAWRQSSGIQPHAFQSVLYCMDLIGNLDLVLTTWGIRSQSGKKATFNVLRNCSCCGYETTPITLNVALDANFEISFGLYESC